jgi:hypothetical protein
MISEHIGYCAMKACLIVERCNYGLVVQSMKVLKYIVTLVNHTKLRRCL